MATATAPRTDAEIQAAVLEELKWDPRVRPNEVGVIVTDGVVALTGWVDSYMKKWAAEQAAHRVKGVKAVANDIEVQLPSAMQRTDAEIAASVVRALERDALLPPGQISVTVSNGYVTLDGDVEWNYQREEAERAVARLTGVKGVSTLIQVKPHVDPQELTQQIQQALIRSVETDARNITVEIDGSTVILRGTVRAWAERAEAERAAWSAPGVTAVDNRITIAY
jgi:osmotically-inducible protein OsmY